jgi:UPF0176 protein
MPFQVSTFYKFFPVADVAGLRKNLFCCLQKHRVRGSVLVAPEGVNGTIAASADVIEPAMEDIRHITGLPDLEHKLSPAMSMPFKRLKVREKKEIVTLGDVAADPNMTVGTYVDAHEWNALVSDPDVLLIDTRNSYECNIGTFEGAVDPHTERFGDFPDFVRTQLKSQKTKKIAMFCTGGIRCEKASSFLRNEGFEHVFHLRGGILKYLEQVPRDKSLWQGSCFVFDERVAVGHGLETSHYSICHGCLLPVSADQRASQKYEEGVCCPACADSLSEMQMHSNRERQRQHVLALKRGTSHLGPKI